MASPEIRRAAKAIRSTAGRVGEYLDNPPVYGEVLTISPVSVELHDSSVVLDEDILIFPNGTDGLAAHDTVVVQEMSDGDWVVLNVLSSTYAGTGSGSAHVIQNHDVTMTQRSKLDFRGGVVLTDDAANDRIIVDVGRKVVATIGDGSASSFSIPHTYETRDLLVGVRETGFPFRQIDATVSFPDGSHVAIEFLAAPAPGQYQVVIMAP